MGAEQLDKTPWTVGERAAAREVAGAGDATSTRVSWLSARRPLALRSALGVVVIALLVGSAFASGLANGRTAPRAGTAARQRTEEASLARLRRQAEQRQAQHHSWIGSRAAISQRVRSRMAFHDLSGHAASGLLLRDFGSDLHRADNAPSISLVTKAPVVRYLGAYKAMVRGPRGPQYVNSTLPLARMVDGREQPIDLQLKGSASGFTPANAPGGVLIARDLAGGVSLQSGGLGIAMEGRNVAGAALGSSSAFFPGVAQDVDATVTPTDSGVELFATLRSELSPEELRYRLTLPVGAVLHAVGGGAEVLRGGHVLASIAPPIAADAQGQNVSVTTTIEGDQLVLHIAHRAGKYAYPILVDPEINKEEKAPGWTFQQGNYEKEFKAVSEGPFVPKNPGSMEVPKGASTEAVSAARWLWKGPSSLKITDIALLYTMYSEPEGYYDEGALVLSGCSTVQPYPVEGGYNFSPDEDGPEYGKCPPTHEIEVFYEIPRHESLPASGHLYIHAMWLTESPITRTSSEDYGGKNEAEEQVPRVNCGKSVNCATGNEFTAHTDLSIGGNPGLGLTRTYNSQLAAEQTSPGPFGYGWTASYGSYLTFTQKAEGCTGLLLCSVNVVTVHQENGSTVSFEETGSGWLAGPLVKATLSERFPSEKYEYTLPDGAVFEFSKAGRLTSEADPNGNVTTLSYNEKNQLTKAEEGEKRSITFVPNSEGLITETKDLLGTVKYTYVSGNLTEVTDVNKHVWKYGYGTSHGMTSQTDPLSHTTTREYDSSHRVISEEDPLKRKRTWKYVTSESGTETTVTNPNGSVTVEHYNKNNLPTSITNAFDTALAATTTYEYGPALNLIAVTDPNKHTTKYAYDVEYDRTSETNADEDTTEWGYSRTGHELESIKTPDGEETKIIRGAHKRPVEVTRETPGGTQTTKYKYDSKGDLESVEDPLKRVWKYEYDAHGDRIAEIDPEGNKRTWAYNEGSQEISTTSPRGNATAGEAARFTTTIEHDAEGRLLSRTEPLREALYGSEFGSSGSGEGQFNVPVGLATDSSGNVWVADTGNNRIEKLSSTGTFLAAYSSIGTGSTALKEPKGVTIDAKGNVWISDTGNHRIVELNSSGTLLLAFGYGVSNGKSEAETCTSKCGAGIEGAGNGQLQGPQDVAIDSKGNVWVAETGDNRVQEFNEKGEYVNKFGSEGAGVDQFKTPNDITISGGNFYVADFTNNRIVELSATGAFVQAIGYGVANGEAKPETCTSTCEAGISGSGNGQFNGPARITTEASSGDLFVADQGNSRIEVLNQAGAFLASFGSAGKGEGQLENLKGVTVTSSGFVYVAEAGNEHIEKWTAPFPRVTKDTYDAAGNLETETDPNGNKTKYTHDSDNELTKTEAPNKAVTETEYDKGGQITSQTDGNKHATKYGRNLLEEITEIIEPLSHKTTKEYDLDGNLSSVTNPAKQTTTYTYDPANRLTEVKYSDGKTPTVKYEYNKDGDRTVMTDGTGTSKYTYDQLDRLTETENGHKEKIKYEYDLANEQTTITYPNEKSIARAYDKDGRLEKVTDWLGNATKFAYDPDSNLASTIFPSVSTNEDTYAYNDVDQMSEVKMLKGTETLASLLYARDGDQQVKTTASKGLPGEEKTTDEYDANDRLTKGGTNAYEYDAANNPAKIGTGTYKYNAADELETGPSLTYAYNELDERTKTTPSTGPATTYGYDGAGNLITVERPEKESVPKIEDSYAYNGEGMRASQAISGTTSYLAWDMVEALPLILSDGTNSYIYGPSSLPVEQISSGGAVSYLHHDQQGSTRLLTGSTGTVTGSTTFDAYGNKTGSSGTATTPLGYDGQYTSSDTGLIYLRNRIYDPATAQFLSVDPLEKLTGAPYNYVEDNPVNAVDPTGLCGADSISEFASCFNPISSGNIAYEGATALSSVTGGVINLPWLLTRPAIVDLVAGGVCAVPLVDAGCPFVLGAAWSVSTSSVVARGIETNFCAPTKLASEEAVTSLLFGFGALGVYSTGAAEVAKAPWYARGIIRGGPAAVESLLNGPAAAHGG